MNAIGNHLWQSTWFAIGVGLLMPCLRRNRAQVRYALWLAASLKFLVPFWLLMSVGNLIEWPPARALIPHIAATAEQVSQPFTTAAVAIPAVRTAPSSTVVPVLIAIWLCGFCGVAVRMALRHCEVREALRCASPLPTGGRAEILRTSGRLEPGIFGIFRPRVILPAGIESRLTPAQLSSILVHELCHIRRKDNLFAALHMMVESVFWFHPLVWYIGGRLVEERELACDEEVLRSGADPRAYAAGILTVCKLYTASSLPYAAGVSGADLKKRVRAIMTSAAVQPCSVARKLLLSTFAGVVLAGPVLVGIVQRADAQTLRFEVASIKKSSSGGGSRYGLRILPGGGLRMEGVTLKALIAFAYDVTEDQIAGGPKWIGSTAYDVVAKPEKGDTTASDMQVQKAAPGTPVWNRTRLRTQALLRERFELQLHEVSREASGYELVPGKGGPKLALTKSENPPTTMRGPGRIDGRNGSIGMLCVVLGNMLGHPVADHTGLTDTYDYSLTYAQDAEAGDPADTNPRPAVETALEEQLGLRLRKSKVEYRSVVVDGAKPGLNPN